MPSAKPRRPRVRRMRVASPAARCLLAEGPCEQGVDRRLAVGLEEASARPAEARLPDHGRLVGAPSVAGPAEPAVALLVERPQRLVQDLGVLGGHSRAAGDGIVLVDPADEEDLLAVLYLVPDRLQYLAEERR